ncbi:MAG: aryl-sulfate sulfotransferase [Woeseiaceae bacterium]
MSSLIMRHSVRALLCLSLLACVQEPASGPTEPAVAAEPERPVARYVSSKRVSTVCGAFDYTTPPPGFAEPPGVTQREMPPPLAKRQAVGADREPVETNREKVSPGYVLIEPLMVKESTVINNDGEIVGRIESDYSIEFTRFLDDGNRLVSTHVHTDTFAGGGGRRGCLEEYSVEGDLLWRLGLATDSYIQHHDAVKLPNGNVLAVVWENISTEEAIAMGRDPEVVAENGQFWYDGIIEVNPYTAEIVWEWSARHHLIQEFDTGKMNYGVVAEHPELLNINATIPSQDGSTDDDWTHVNALDYNPELDLIIFSSNYLSEVYVIDHSTTAWEAAGHSGGRHGKGGDFLYRWGNPQNYGRGSAEQRTLFNQHDIQWIKPGLPGAGNLLVFNNGNPDVRPYSTVLEFAPEVNADGSFRLDGSAPYSTDVVVWDYDPEPPERFFSFFISGAQRLPNGNTIITHGAGAKIREVTSEAEIVWEYTYEDDIDAPHMLFRGNRYPVDHPGLVNIVSGSIQQ